MDWPFLRGICKSEPRRPIGSMFAARTACTPDWKAVVPSSNVYGQLARESLRNSFPLSAASITFPSLSS